MKIKSLSAMNLDIPFVESFSHATKTRQASDSILVRVESDEGIVGWGETLVRPYVSGETVATALSLFAEIASGIKQWNWQLDERAESAEARFRPLTETLDAVLSAFPLSSGVRAWNGVRCGLELAVLDALSLIHI